MKLSVKCSKAAQLSAVLTLSAIVSGCAVPDINATATELASLDADVQEILHDEEGYSQEHYDNQQLFFDSKFDYDDAAILATYWGETVDDAKARIGGKLVANDGVEVVDDILQTAKQAIAEPDFEPLTRTGPEDPNRQAYIESSFDYDDAELLAAFWGIDIDDAKARIGRTLRQDEGFDVVVNTLEAAADWEMSQTEGDESGVATPSVQARRQAYFDSDYTYDDAELLAAYWDTSVDNAKVRLGGKLILNGPQLVNEILQDAARSAGESEIDESDNRFEDPTFQRERQAYFDSDYSYDDAVLLADFWGIDIDDSKARMGRKILWGGENIDDLNDYLEDAEAHAVSVQNVRNAAQ